MKRFFLGLVVILAALPSVARPYAFLEGDTLRIGNSLIERTFVWNEGHLMTVSLTDKKAGYTLQSEILHPDFSIGRNQGRGGILHTVADRNSIIASILFHIGKTEVRRDYTIREGVPAIECGTYIKGVLEDTGALVLDRLSFPGKHWQGKAVEFHDRTDDNNNLVESHPFLSFHRKHFKGNLLFARDVVSGSGFFFLKESPAGDSQLHYGGFDFTAEYGEFSIAEGGLESEDLSPEGWTRLYGCVTGVSGFSELDALVALRLYQKSIRPFEDMVVMNTWGDRGQDAKVCEAFCLAELERGARLGISCLQIDDGWQKGKSPNSVSGGTFNDIWRDGQYWMPDPGKYPHGLGPVVDKGNDLGVDIGLWFNPSIQNDYSDWERDAEVLVGLNKEYGIRIFKIDGVQLPTREAEENLRNMLAKVRSETGGGVVFNLDATAGRRAGFHYFGEYGNIFLENRYTDWGNYYPYQTLRNLWMLSRYVPAEKLQVEFLNPWRNAGKYPQGDPFAPSGYSFEYLVAITLAGQPLAWLEASNLPEEGFSIGGLVNEYRKLSYDFHKGIILPVGEEPDGNAWTGFQSIIDDSTGYLLVYRENSNAKEASLRTWLPQGKRIRLIPVLGSGHKGTVRVGEDGSIHLVLEEKNSYALYRYQVS